MYNSPFMTGFFQLLSWEGLHCPISGRGDQVAGFVALIGFELQDFRAGSSQKWRRRRRVRIILCFFGILVRLEIIVTKTAMELQINRYIGVFFGVNGDEKL